MSGNELCNLTHEEFCKKIEKDPGNIFWTHLQLLKECKFVAVVHKALEKDGEEKQSYRSLKSINEPKTIKKCESALDAGKFKLRINVHNF